MMKVGLMSAASSIKADLLTEKFISPYGFVSGNMASKKSSTKTESFLELWRRCKLANPSLAPPITVLKMQPAHGWR